MSSSGDSQSEDPSLPASPVSVAFLLVALNMAERTAAPARADSLYLLAQGLDRQRHPDQDPQYDRADSADRIALMRARHSSSKAARKAARRLA